MEGQGQRTRSRIPQDEIKGVLGGRVSEDTQLGEGTCKWVAHVSDSLFWNAGGLPHPLTMDGGAGPTHIPHG